MNALPSSTIKLISSTQVVTSIYAVVKELVENSLDASCDSIDVRLEENGLGKIEVHDNGTGIPSDSISYVCKPHYTSKIRDDSDLLKLTTYGFRGEALSSVCSVADVSIITKRQCDFVSKQYFFNKNGDVLREQPTHHNVGTAIIVRNLFHCIPVRRQIYSNGKKLKDEVRKIEELLMAYSLAYPKLRITLKNEKSITWRKDRKATLQDAVRGIFGVGLFENLTETNINESDIQISALVPRPNCNVEIVSRLVADRIFTYVNKRPVLIKDMKTILKQYFNEHCNVGNKKYPTAIMFITIATDMVDVNLEPNKTAVHLENMETLMNLTKKLLDFVYVPDKDNCCEDTVASVCKDTNKNIPIMTLDNGDGFRTVHIEEEQNTLSENGQKGSIDKACRQNEINPCSDNCQDMVLTNEIGSSHVTEVVSKHCQPTALNIDEILTENVSKKDKEKHSGCEEKAKKEKLTANVKHDQYPIESIDLSVDVFDDALDDEFVFNLLSENLTSEKWSRGTSVTNSIPPVTLQLQPPEKTKDTTVGVKRKMDVSNDKTTKSFQRKEMPHNDLNGSNKKSKRRRSAPVCQLEFSMEYLSKAFKNTAATKEHTDDKITVIGKIPNTTFWCVSSKTKTLILDKARLSEKLLYDQLVKKHKFNVEKLDVPIKLNSDFLGFENFNSLLRMETKTPVTTIGRYVSDRRLIDNGFRIKRVENTDTSEISFVCTHMTNTILNYSAKDLVELLDSIRGDSVLVRSKNALAWFQVEAARLSHENAESCSKEELEEILANSVVANQIEQLTCCHGEPVVREIVFGK